MWYIRVFYIAHFICMFNTSLRVDYLIAYRDIEMVVVEVGREWNI
jgi:hypothetical protein